MAISVSYPDKILAGLNQSYTVVSDEGEPRVKIRLSTKELPHRVIPLGPPKSTTESTSSTYKYKVSFFLPDDAVGKTLKVEVEAGSSRIEESKPVTDS